MMDSKLWEEFVTWWKEKWPQSSPDRESVTLFLEWQEVKLKNVPWDWSFKKASSK